MRLTTALVKPSVFSIGKGRAKLLKMAAGVEGLEERMRFVLRERGWSERRWAREAKLSETHPQLILKRLPAEPGRPTVEVWVLAQLAEAANVSLDWLVFGRGPMRSAPRAEEDPAYPSRAGAVAACYAMGLPEAAIDRIRSITGLASDPGTRFWLDQAMAMSVGISGLLPPAPPPAASPAEGHPKRAKRARKK